MYSVNVHQSAWRSDVFQKLKSGGAAGESYRRWKLIMQFRLQCVLCSASKGDVTDDTVFNLAPYSGSRVALMRLMNVCMHAVCMGTCS